MPTSRLEPSLRNIRFMLGDAHTDVPRRQGQVLLLESLGYTHPEIAHELHVSLATVRNTAYAVRRRVAPASMFDSRNGSVAWAWHHGGCCLQAARVSREMQALQLPARVDDIRLRHYERFSFERQCVLVTEAMGLSPTLAARLLRRTVATMRYHEERAREEIVDADWHNANAAMTAWIHLHAGCCLHPLWAALLTTPGSQGSRGLDFPGDWQKSLLA